MDNKNTGLIATIAAVVLCGCPGLCLCFFGALSAFAGFVPGADIDVAGSSDPSSAIAMGFGSICVSILFIAIPIAVWYFMMRKKPVVTDNEPLPPAS